MADSIHLNLRNPAAYSKLQADCLYSWVYHTREFRLRGFNNEHSEMHPVTNLEYLSIGFPIAKNAGIGIWTNTLSRRSVTI